MAMATEKSPIFDNVEKEKYHEEQKAWEKANEVTPGAKVVYIKPDPNYPYEYEQPVNHIGEIAIVANIHTDSLSIKFKGDDEFYCVSFRSVTFIEKAKHKPFDFSDRDTRIYMIDKLLESKKTSQILKVSYVDRHGVMIADVINLHYTPEHLFENYKFLNGRPCGDVDIPKGYMTDKEFINVFR